MLSVLALFLFASSVILALWLVRVAWWRWSGMQLDVDVGHVCDERLRRVAERLRALRYVAPVWTRLWLIGSHAHTFYAVLLRRTAHLDPQLKWRSFNVQVSEGGTVRVDEIGDDAQPAVVVVVVPGIAGSSAQHYVRSLVAHIRDVLGCHVAVFNHRGCGTSELTSPHLFTFGCPDDLAHAVRAIHKRYPSARKAIVGCSLGANIAMNYLALSEAERGVPIAAGVSLCQAFDARRSHAALSPLYARILLKKMLKLVSAHGDVLRRHGVDVERVLESRDGFEFDTRFTLPLHKRRWQSVDEYYDDCSCLPRIDRIRVPTLLFNALDDPLIPVELVDEARRSSASREHLMFATTHVGGHLGHAVGFVLPTHLSFSDAVIAEFLRQVLD